MKILTINPNYELVVNYLKAAAIVKTASADPNDRKELKEGLTSEEKESIALLEELVKTASAGPNYRKELGERITSKKKALSALLKEYAIDQDRLDDFLLMNLILYIRNPWGLAELKEKSKKAIKELKNLKEFLKGNKIESIKLTSDSGPFVIKDSFLLRTTSRFIEDETVKHYPLIKPLLEARKGPDKFRKYANDYALGICHYIESEGLMSKRKSKFEGESIYEFIGSFFEISDINLEYLERFNAGKPVDYQDYFNKELGPLLPSKKAQKRT